MHLSRTDVSNSFLSRREITCNFRGLGGKLKRSEAVDMITSALRDAIDASERSQASQAPDKLWLQRARASIALLDTKRA